VAWYAGSGGGIVIGVISAFAWLGVELAWHRTYSHHLIPYSNGILQLAVTIFSAVVTAAVAERNRKLQAEIAVRLATEAQLNALNETLELRVAERSAAAENRAEELSRSEAALHRQTSILKSILISMGDGVVVTDKAGNIRLHNPTAAALLKIPSAAGAGSEWADAAGTGVKLPGLLRSYAIAEHVLGQSLNGESFDGVEFGSRSESARPESWLSMTTRPLVDDQGAFQGVVFVFSDITARKQIDRLVADVSEREQQRIGQDLHDGLGQHLVSTAFAANMLKDRLAEKKLPEAGDAGEIADLLNAAITQSRNLARGLYPIKLEGEGLASALEELASNTSRKAGIECGCQLHPSALVYDASVSANLYRLAQEAINNALKHGQPQQILIRLWRQGSVLTLTVINDGRKFAPPGPGNQGMGLHIMNYRARIIGAELNIEPGAAGGTVVHCSVPILEQPKSLHAAS